jgi:hypothetical protein
MTTKKTKTKKSKPEPYPISYCFFPDLEEDMHYFGVERQVKELIRQGKSLGKRWEHAIWQVNPTTIVMPMARAGSDGISGSWGVTLCKAEFENDEQKFLAVKALRRQVGKWAKSHCLQKQPAKQLEVLPQAAGQSVD